MSRPKKNGGTQVDTVRTRRRQPKRQDEAKAAVAIANTLAAQQGGAQVFSLHGQPIAPAPSAPAAPELLTLGLYRRIVEDQE